MTKSLPERDVNAINKSFKRTTCQAIHDLAYGRAQRPAPRPIWRSPGSVGCDDRSRHQPAGRGNAVQRSERQLTRSLAGTCQRARGARGPWWCRSATHGNSHRHAFPRPHKRCERFGDDFDCVRNAPLQADRVEDCLRGPPTILLRGARLDERPFSCCRECRRSSKRHVPGCESKVTIEVQVGGVPIPIRRAVFTTLLDNSVAGTYADYDKALASGAIKFPALLRLARIGEIPYPLFFADLPFVETQVAAKTEKLLAGVSKETFSIGSRSPVELRDVELVLKDLIRKQELLKRHDGTLEKNRIIGLLRKVGPSVEDDASRLMSAIGLTHEAMRACRTKERALDLMIERLESKPGPGLPQRPALHAAAPHPCGLQRHDYPRRQGAIHLSRRW